MAVKPKTDLPSQFSQGNPKNFSTLWGMQGFSLSPTTSYTKHFKEPNKVKDQERELRKQFENGELRLF